MNKKKTILKIKYYSVLCLFLVFTLLLFIFSGCQEESEEITLPPSDKVIMANSAIADYIRSIALSDGSSDNIVDHASCTGIVFPVRVVVNGEEIQINSADDLKTVEGILDESEIDHDTLSFIFPLTVTLSDHTELVISNAEEFEDAAEQCTEGGHDDDIECVDFKYPLSLFVYDSEIQLSHVITINDDAELFAFFDTLEEGHFAGFKFPVTVMLTGGEEIMVSDNDHLEDIIEDHKDDCDEDDDNDHNDDDADDSGLIAALLGADWEITHYFTGTDETDVFAGFVITFYDDRTTLSSDGGSSVEGEWETNGDDGTLVLELGLGEGAPFDTMPHTWGVLEFNNALIHLKKVNTEDGSETTMVLEKI